MMTDIPGRYPRDVPTGSPAGTDDELRRDVSLRQQALQRVKAMNAMHAMHAWERRYADPLAPYGLAFLYAQPDARHRLALRVATKLWLAGPEVADLPLLLYRLNEAVAERAKDPTFDPRWDLANRVDERPGERMAADAWYVGLGLSSLDSYSGTWQQACATCESYTDVPGQIRVVLTDTTTIVCDRRGAKDFDTLTVHSTQPLSLSFADALWRWNATSLQELHSDPAHADVLRWTGELNRTLWHADRVRLDARQRARASRPHRRQP
jgi:hypothetical protein